MKKIMVGLLTLTVLLAAALCLSFPSGNTEGSAQALLPELHEERDFVSQQKISFLPLSLVKIDEEAFSGTGLSAVVLPEKVEYVADYAFAKTHALTNLYILSETAEISDRAFSGLARLAIHGSEQGRLREWALSRGYSFVPCEKYIPQTGLRFTADSHSENHSLSALPNPAVPAPAKTRPAQRLAGQERSRRPQERAELHPIDYRFP